MPEPVIVAARQLAELGRAPWFCSDSANDSLRGAKASPDKLQLRVGSPLTSAVRRSRRERQLRVNRAVSSTKGAVRPIPQSGPDREAGRDRALYLSAATRRNSRFIASTWARYVATSWSPQRSPAIRWKPWRANALAKPAPQR